MRSGSPILFDIALLDANGSGLSYASQAAFVAAGWDLSFIDMSTGIAVTPTISYTIAPVSGVDGRHVVGGITLTTVAWAARITPPSGSGYAFQVLPSAMWTGEQNDADTIYARLNSVYGVTSVTSVPGLNLNNMVEGDSYATTVTVPTSYLSRMGWTDLSGTTLDGTIRRSDDTTTGTPAATLTEGAYPKLVHNATLTAFDITWLAYPSGMVLTTPDRTTGSHQFRVEVQAKKGSQVLTILYNAPLIVYRQDDIT